ncbi:unnamed protein product [Cunninghamella echinulata]
MSTSTCHNCQGSLLFEKVKFTTPQQQNNDLLLLRTELGQLREQISIKNQQLEQQQKDMEQLNNKYVKALDQVAHIQHEKDLAERELEELTCKLFEEANTMVADEKRKVNQLELELNDIKKEKQRQSLVFYHHDDNDDDNDSSSSSSSSSFEWIYDRHQFTLFQQFLQAYVIKPQLNQHKQHAFLKQCIKDDIEPCLNQRLLSQNKKLIDALMDQTYQLEQVQPHHHEEASSSTPSLSSTLTKKTTLKWSQFISSSTGVNNNNNNNNNKDSQMDCCAGCGQRIFLLNETHVYYRFKINGSNNGGGDWLYLDTPCYDRLFAVCQFFNYLNQLYTTTFNQHQHHLPRSIEEDEDLYHSIYMDLFQLKLTMLHVRLGIKQNHQHQNHQDNDTDTDSTVSTQGPMTPKNCLSRRMSYQVSDGK